MKIVSAAAFVFNKSVSCRFNLQGRHIFKYTSYRKEILQVIDYLVCKMNICEKCSKQKFCKSTDSDRHYQNDLVSHHHSTDVIQIRDHSIGYHARSLTFVKNFHQ